MKKILSLILALMMVASLAAVAVNADILYEDDFEGDDFNWNFWGDNGRMGKFVVENGKMSGWEDAKIGQSKYEWEPGQEGVSATSDWPSQKEFSEWMDVNVDEGGIGEEYGAGFWFQDGGDLGRGYASDRTVYRMLYFANEGEHLAFVRLNSDNPMKDKRPEEERPFGEHVYGELDLPEYITENEDGDPVGFNLESDPVRIGVRFGRGSVTGYANGKIVGSYEYETIGTMYTPLLVTNINCYVEFDNYVLATYDHNVKKATRLDNYEPYEGKVVITDGAKVLEERTAVEDDELKIKAPAVSGMAFDKWEAVSVGGQVITDANIEKISLLYGIEIGSLNDAEFAITMPDVDIELKAVYKEGSDDSGSDTSDTGDNSTEPGPNPGPSTMLGDVNGDGKINSRDIILVMKASLDPKGTEFIFENADMNKDGKINSRDIIEVMKASLVA